ncbi:MAG: SH3 domain-containing protein [Deltaproteobacteria bacterium]|nr:SH3 domain-containing protein [Deltaproteobacteria bacterium]
MRIVFIILSIFLFLVPAQAHSQDGVETPDYWIERLPSPDAVVLDAHGIAAFNGMVVSRVDQTADVAGVPDEISGDKLRAWLNHDPIPDLTSAKRYDARGRRIGRAFLNGISSNMNTGAVADRNPARFGVILERGDVRGFPTDGPILRKPGHVSFDTVQYSSIYPGTPVALLHVSKDKEWGFFQTPLIRGWIRLDKAAFGKRTDLAPISGVPLVITGSHVNVFADAAFGRPLASMPMGSALAVTNESGAAWEVRFPARGTDGGLVWATAYVDKKADARRGFVPYTARNVINQAFKMMGEPYGWGGMGGRRDCSEFLMDAFATVGVRLPRNSQQQLLAGAVRPGGGAAFTNDSLMDALAHARPGVAFLATSGHIMLYLGEVDGRPYVIHQAHGYTAKNRKHIVDRVAVSPLGWGKKTDRPGVWPLLQRVKTVTEPSLSVDYKVAAGL